jgi:hypothetical protein
VKPTHLTQDGVFNIYTKEINKMHKEQNAILQVTQIKEIPPTKSSKLILKCRITLSDGHAQIRALLDETLLDSFAPPLK